MQSKSSDLRVYAAEEGESLAARIVHGMRRQWGHNVLLAWRTNHKA
jgi:hypothetical protein